MQTQILKFNKTDIYNDASSCFICDFCSMFNNSNLILLILDMDFSIVLFNDRFSELVGIENKENLIGKNFMDFLPEKQKTKLGILPKKLLLNENHIYREMVLELKTQKCRPCVIKWFNSITSCQGIDFLCMIGMVLTEGSEETEEKPITHNDYRIQWENVISKHKALIKSIKNGEVFNE